MTAVKVCGLMTPADVALVNRVHPDYAGFVLAAGRHQVSPKHALALAAGLAAGITPVAVVVAPDLDQLAKLRPGITTVQLHRPAAPSLVAALHALGFTVFARVTAEQPTTTADLALLDAGDGSGQTLDWHHLPRVNRPLMLAGGLDGGNVQAAIACTHPALVDASSRLETKGRKDAAKVQAFVVAVRETERNFSDVKR
ncbi:phosphoribosylanthranilate isomerase [Lacticaseibacillus jixianensis]|uniref:N-(5'-phosphoribosyl)anthranilate isomerase n=1 Tax=Lacticaseibacillus jixianensis TaxID=2486012 RepID=A0ABW4B5G5_9LACO|nr:phosphoribosylanthranilate isomerase [Lacticaseibacillus jixianensis]